MIAYCALENVSTAHTEEYHNFFLSQPTHFFWFAVNRNLHQDHFARLLPSVLLDLHWTDLTKKLAQNHTSYVKLEIYIDENWKLLPQD